MSLRRAVLRLLTLLALLAASAAQALDPRRAPEDYVVDHWGIAAGLPQVSVTSITRDAEGYLWLSTQGGLARFDGAHFRSFGAAELRGYDPAIQDRLWTDASGRLWLGGPRGAAWLRDEELLPVSGLDPAIGQVNAFADAPGGGVLLAAERGLLHWSAGSVRALVEGRRIHAVAVRDGRIHAAADGEVLSIEPDGQLQRLVAADADADAVRYTRLAWLGQSLYVGSSRGLFVLQPQQQVLRQPVWAAQLQRLSIEALHADRDGNLWIGLLDGLLRWHPERGLERALHRLDDVQAWVTAFHEDADGNLWVGSYTTGLSRWWDGWAQRIGSQRGLADPFVWSVAAGPDGRVWLGTATGLWRLDEAEQPQLVVNLLGLASSAVYSLHVDRGGRAWIGTRAGLVRWDGERLQQPAEWAVLAQNQINSVLQDADGRHWIGSSGGLFVQPDASSDRIEAVAPLAGQAVRVLLWQQGRLLIGTEQGLWLAEGQHYAPLTAHPLLAQALVTALLALPDGRVLVGSFDDGLFLLDGERVQAIGVAEGLPWPQVANLQWHQGQVWASGTRGVYRFALDAMDRALRQGQPLRVEPVLNEARDARGGQRLRCCNAGGSSRGLVLNELLWFPSLNGLVRIDPAAIRPPPTPPRVLIEELRTLDGQRWLARSPLRLPLGWRDVELHYTALSLRDADGIRFRHRLVGFDRDWSPASARRSVRYTNLPPGRYRFEVEARTGAGQPAQGPASLVIEIPPRLAERRWFRALLVLAAAGLGVLLLLWTRRRAQQREQALQRQVEARTADLRRANERLRNANQALAAESLSDGLTGLKNRRFMARHMGEWRRSRQQGECAGRLWLFLLDLDHFKRVNDLYGHLAGDEVLRQVASLLQELAAADGYALRWGGEEFLLLLPESALDSPELLAGRLLAALRSTPFRLPDGRDIELTASLGVAAFPALHDESDLVDWALAMELADVALYRSKQRGRDRWSRLLPSAHASYSDFGAGFGSQVEELLARGLASWRDQPS